jgi:2-oxoisovalerate dehydrogenase E1 component
LSYLVQDNEWGISTTAREGRAMNAFDFAMGYKGLERVKVDGTVFEYAFGAINYAIDYVRERKKTNSATCKSSVIKSPYKRCKKRVLPHQGRHGTA